MPSFKSLHDRPHCNSRMPNLDRIRELQGPMTRAAFSEKCDLHPMTIYRMSRGHRADLDTLKAIAAAFNLDVEELMLPESLESRLCDRISQLDLWPDLLEALCGAVAIGGAAAMRTFTEESRGLVDFGFGRNILAAKPQVMEEKNAIDSSRC